MVVAPPSQEAQKRIRGSSLMVMDEVDGVSGGKKDLKELTELYLRLRETNNVEGLKKIFDPTVQMHIDVERAGPLVKTRILSALAFATDLSGKDGVARYYRGLPVIPTDHIPQPDMFHCFVDTCIISSTVSRPGIGNIRVVADLTWTRDRTHLLNIGISFELLSDEELERYHMGLKSYMGSKK
jgi:hypothetical protein